MTISKLSSRGRPRLALVDKFSAHRPGPYLVQVVKMWQQVLQGDRTAPDVLRITYRGNFLADVPNTPLGETMGYDVIGRHQQARREQAYKKRRMDGRKPLVRDPKPGGRPLVEPVSGLYKLGSRMIQKTPQGWIVTHNHNQIACCGSYAEARATLKEHVMFWCQPRKPTRFERSVSVPNKRGCYRRIVDGAGNYCAVYHKRVVVRAPTPEACNAGIEEHWAFVQPIRALDREAT